MKLELLEFLLDPFGKFSRFEVVDVQKEQESEILEATLRSEAGNCYPIINGIPRILIDNLIFKLAPVSRYWLTKYKPHIQIKPKIKDLQIRVASSFNAEWRKFNEFVPDYNELFRSYFFLWRDKIVYGDDVLDAGCGMGRWSKFVAKKSKRLFCVDISESIDIAKEYLKLEKNILFVQADLVNLPFRDNLFDSIYSLGVLHHIPDTKKAFFELYRVIKEEGDLLTYLYYSFDNRPYWYKLLFYISDMLRLFISKLPKRLAHFFAFFLALLIYEPFVYLGKFLNFIGLTILANKLPLYQVYKDKSFYVIFNDSIDRFSTPLEKRFSKKEIATIFRESGFKEITFQDTIPYWITNARKI